MEKNAKIISEINFQVNNSFEKIFGNTKAFSYAIAPAALIFLGDHTHYNDGILISTAVNRYCAVAIRKRDDDKINIFRKDSNTTASFDLSNFDIDNSDSGFRLIKGLTKLLKEDEHINKGFDCVVYSCSPDFLGLGCFAAQQVAFITAAKKAFEIKLPIKVLLSYIKTNEQNIIGKISNPAHYTTSAFAKTNKFYLTDLRNNTFKSIPFDQTEYKIISFTTDEEFSAPNLVCNERIEECEVGVKGVRLYIWGIKNLRDVKFDFMQKHFHMLPKRIFNRIAYNVKERIRTEEAYKSLKQQDIKGFGSYIFNSHKSLSEDYDLSIPTLDFIVEECKATHGVFGAKMISCSPSRTVFALVKSDQAKLIAEKIDTAFKNKFSKELTINYLSTTNGAKLISYKEIHHKNDD
ncbi:MAG: galactokinase family protein [Melioribacteraceae bacterium]